MCCLLPRATGAPYVGQSGTAAPGLERTRKWPATRTTGTSRGLILSLPQQASVDGELTPREREVLARIQQRCPTLKAGSDARSTKTTPSRKSGAAAAPTASASRVFPTPTGTDQRQQAYLWSLERLFRREHIPSGGPTGHTLRGVGGQSTGCAALRTLRQSRKAAQAGSGRGCQGSGGRPLSRVSKSGIGYGAEHAFHDCTG
jgi:hypothetical protein